MEIAIPDPCLVVLIGAAGAGKSTFAARHFERSEVLSSDDYRALISGDAADQTATGAAFGRLHRDLTRRLADRRLSVVDATNLTRGARMALLRRAALARLPAVAIVFDLPADLVLARNAGRPERIVDELVVRNHLDLLRATLSQGARALEAEGFSKVIVLRDALDVDAVGLDRTPLDSLD